MAIDINEAGDVDVYAFDVQARHDIRVYMIRYGSRRIVPLMRLRGPSWQMLDARYGNGWSMSGYAATAARYYLQISHLSPTAAGQQYQLEIYSYPYPDEQHRGMPLYPVQKYRITDGERLVDPQSIEVVDATGDGRGDVLVTTLVTSASRPAMYLLPSRGRGILGRPRRWLFPKVPSGVQWEDMGIASGNLIGGRRPEVVVGLAQGVQIFVPRDGTLARGTLLKTPYAVQTVSLTDMNRDGRRDVIANTLRGVFVIRQTASGFASPRRIVTAAMPILRIADVVGDARKDLVGSLLNDGDVRVYRQRSDGTFARPALLRVRGEGPPSVEGIVLRDLTGDGRRDIVADNYPSINVFVRTQSGWSAPRVNAVGQSSPPEAAADLNGDGRAELVGLTDVLLLDATGGVERFFDFSFGGARGADRVATRDVSGDGRPDVVSTGPQGPIVARGNFRPN